MEVIHPLLEMDFNWYDTEHYHSGIDHLTRSRPTADCAKESSKNGVQKCPPNTAGAGRQIKDKDPACKKPTTTKNRPPAP